jgi:hypothetical protein
MSDKRIGYENFNNLFVRAIFKFILQQTAKKMTENDKKAKAAADPSHG